MKHKHAIPRPDLDKATGLKGIHSTETTVRYIDRDGQLHVAEIPGCRAFYSKGPDASLFDREIAACRALEGESREKLPIDFYASLQEPKDPMTAHQACIADCIRLARYIKAQGRAIVRLGHLEGCRVSGVELIQAERERQVSAEGWTAEHDNAHQRGELIDAALSYIRAAINVGHPAMQNPPTTWPWERECWKPSEDPIRNLVKGAALLAAEVDRIQRRMGVPTEQIGKGISK